jgi:hypothetical protein
MKIISLTVKNVLFKYKEIIFLVAINAIVFYKYWLGISTPPWDFLGGGMVEQFRFYKDGGFFNPPSWYPYAWFGIPEYQMVQDGGWFIPVWLTSDLFGWDPANAARLQAFLILFSTIGMYLLAKTLINQKDRIQKVEDRISINLTEIEELKAQIAAIPAPEEAKDQSGDGLDVGFKFKGQNIVFIIDTSLSMLTEDRMGQVKAGLKMTWKIKKVRKPGIKKKFEICFPFRSRANPLICSELKKIPRFKNRFEWSYR